MSRIGKVPVVVPKGVKIAIASGSVQAEGPKGKLSLRIPYGIGVELKEEKLLVSRASDKKQDRANQGTIRALLVNVVTGVMQGHKRNLEIQGVGFRAQAQGQKLGLTLGFSHPVDFPVPAGVTVKTATPTTIEVEGVDSALVR